MAALKQSYTFRDHIGRVALIRTYVADVATGNNLRIALAAVTNGIFVVAHGPYTTVPAALSYPGTAQYVSVLDKARMSMLDQDGMIHEFLIPAPIIAMFQADLITVNLLNGSVAAFQSSMVANAQTSGGRAFTQLIAGRRTMGKQPRRGIASPNPSP